MNAQAFENTIRSRHPHKWMTKDYSFLTNEELVFAMDTHGECQLDLGNKHRLASHVLNLTLGCVVKDSDGMFTSKNQYTAPVGGHFSITANITDWSIMSDDKAPIQHQIPKCICGSKSVGSNRHSSWCEIKEGM